MKNLKRKVELESVNDGTTKKRKKTYVEKKIFLEGVIEKIKPKIDILEDISKVKEMKIGLSNEVSEKEKMSIDDDDVYKYFNQDDDDDDDIIERSAPTNFSKTIDEIDGDEIDGENNVAACIDVVSNPKSIAINETLLKVPNISRAVNKLWKDTDNVKLSTQEMKDYLSRTTMIITELDTLAMNNSRVGCMKHDTWIIDMQMRLGFIHKSLSNQLGIYIGSGIVEQKLTWRESEKAFKDAIKNGFIQNYTYTDVRLFIKDCISGFKPIILAFLTKKHPIKIYFSLLAELKMQKVEQKDDIYTTIWFNTKAYPLLHESEDIDEWFEEYVLKRIEQRIDEFINKGSG
ncbi:hypothetical protein TKK_0009625 [Trichogramma kaykai]